MRLFCFVYKCSVSEILQRYFSHLTMRDTLAWEATSFTASATLTFYRRPKAFQRWKMAQAHLCQMIVIYEGK